MFYNSSSDQVFVFVVAVELKVAVLPKLLFRDNIEVVRFENLKCD